MFSLKAKRVRERVGAKKLVTTSTSRAKDGSMRGRPPKTKTTREWVLLKRIEDIDKALELNEARERIAASEYERQEVNSERNGLLRQREITRNQLADMRISSPLLSEEDELKVEIEVARRRESIEHNISRWEASGDHRQARIWREELMHVREHILREFHGR